jgi:hypothetical protein
MPTFMPRVLGTAAVAASALAIVASSGAPALAATAGDTGTATITEPNGVVVSMARAGITILPGGPDTSIYAGGHDTLGMVINGGRGDVNILHGVLNLAGSLTYIHGSKTVTFWQLRFSYDTGNISGVTGKAHTRMAIATASGNFSETVAPGTDPNTEKETFSASQTVVAPAGARYLDKILKTRHFRSGANLGRFAATYIYTIPAT